VITTTITSRQTTTVCPLNGDIEWQTPSPKPVGPTRTITTTRGAVSCYKCGPFAPTPKLGDEVTGCSTCGLVPSTTTALASTATKIVGEYECSTCRVELESVSTYTEYHTTAAPCSTCTPFTAVNLATETTVTFSQALASSSTTATTKNIVAGSNTTAESPATFTGGASKMTKAIQGQWVAMLGLWVLL
jgi:hypothetical protein